MFEGNIELKDFYSDTTKYFLNLFEDNWVASLYQIPSSDCQLSYGNRLRPQLCLWGYLATINEATEGSVNFESIVNTAVCIELTHKASLLLDDWIDNDEKRRGVAAYHVVNGVHETVLCAIKMLSLAYDRIGDSVDVKSVPPHNYYLSVRTLSSIIQSMADGAILELSSSDNTVISYSDVKRITQMQTSEILGNSMILGYYTGEKNAIDHKTVDTFKRIGDICGYYFQIMNDLESFLNPSGIQKHKGNKTPELEHSNKNFVTSKLWCIANDSDRNLISLGDGDDIMPLIQKYNIIELMLGETDDINLYLTDYIRNSDLPMDWRIGFLSFLEDVNNYATERLK